MARVFIFGGHGKVALRLERLLADRGDDVTALIRNPDHADEVSSAGATPVVADVQTLSAEEMATLIAGHSAVVWAAGAGGGDAERTYAVDRDAAIRSMDAAAEVGVNRYVMVSWVGSRPDHGVPEDNAFFPYADAKLAADEHLRGSSLSYTILGPGTLTLDEPTGAITTEPEGSADVSRADVAAVAAEALLQSATVGRTIRFSAGPTPIAEALAQL